MQAPDGRWTIDQIAETLPDSVGVEVLPFIADLERRAAEAAAAEEG